MIWSLNNRSYKWKQIRIDHLKNNNFCCGCGKKDKLEVHHIEPYHVNKERELDPSNLITLCKSCHFIIGHLMDWNSWNVDVINDAKVYLNKVKNRPYSIKVQSNENFNIRNCFNRMLKLLCRNTGS